MSEAPKRPRRPPPPVETTPIIGGRLWLAIAMLIGLGLIANPKFNQELVSRYAPKEPYTDVRKWQIGKEGDVRITVVTADAYRLSCAHDTELEGVHCGYNGETKPWQRPEGAADDNNQNTVQPYRTSPDNQLILVSGLWATPALSMRLHREPPQGANVKRLQRFEARCRVKFLGYAEKVKVRWDTNARWYPEPKAMVAKALNCTVAGAE